MEVVLTPKFRSTVKKLRRRYRNVTHDVTSLIQDLSGGKTPGDRIQDLGGAEVYKVRLQNTSARLSKRAGFRVYIMLATWRSPCS